MGKRYPIVVIGHTGCGKSTFVNVCANNFKYNDYGEAFEKNMPEIVIPISFNVQTTSITTIRKVTLPENSTSDNEKFGSSGRSSTQKARQHVLNMGNGDELLIVDTPGLCDTRGPDVDKQNINNVIDELAKLHEVYGIVIFISANQSKLDDEFKYVIATLLSRFHKSAAKNVFFVFTHTYSFDFSPNDGFIALTDFLQNNSILNNRIVAGENNTFCIDSAGFRGQCIKHKYPDTYARNSRNHIMYEKCWNKSKEAITKLLNAIKGTKPHKIAESITVAQAPDVIMLLAEPLAIATVIVTHYLQGLENATWNELLSGVKKHLLTYDIEYKELPRPRTVCTSEKCIKVSTLNGNRVSRYDTICHDPCYLKGVQVVRFPEERLKDCHAFGTLENCKTCGCSWEKHMHIDYEQDIKPAETPVSQLLQEISDLPETEGRKKLEELISALKEEQTFINDALIKFGLYLKENELLQDSPYVVNHMKAEIRKAELIAKATKLNKDIDMVESLKKNLKELELRRSTLENVSKLVSNGTTPYEDITCQDIANLRQQLFDLDIMGPKVKDIYDKLSKKTSS